MLLCLITWPYVRKHALRTMLTVAGIALGVAVFVGMNSANASVLRAFSQTIDQIAGRAELQITSGETGFAEDVLDRVQSVPSVRVAVPVIEAVADPHIRGEGSLLILGVDLIGDRNLRDYDLESGDDAVIDDPLVFLAQPDSIMLSRAFADKNHIAAGDRLTLGTAEGDRTFSVRGVMKVGGLASAFGGNLAVMDIYAAQKMFGRGHTFDRIDVALTPGRTIAESTRELETALGSGFQIAPPSGRGQQFESMIAGYSLMMNASSVFALFIGMFIIYNSFATAVSERRKEIGVLRALGASRTQVRLLFLLESAVAGLLGSLAGIIAGTFIARGIAASIGGLIHDVYGVAREAVHATATPGLLAVSLAIGIGTSMIAAWIPARAAAAVDPVRALQKGGDMSLSSGETRARLVLAAVSALGSTGCLLLDRPGALFYASYVLATLFAMLLTPFLSVGLMRLLRPLLKWVRPVEGTLAADSLIQAPRRTSGSVAALMLSFALVVAWARVPPQRMATAFVLGLLVHAAVGFAQVIVQNHVGLTVLGELRIPPDDPLKSVRAGDSLFLRAYGLSPHPNVLAGHLAIGLILCWGLAAGMSRVGRALVAVAWAIVFACLLLTFSRSGLLAAVLWSLPSIIWKLSYP